MYTMLQTSVTTLRFSSYKIVYSVKQNKM